MTDDRTIVDVMEVQLGPIINIFLRAYHGVTTLISFKKHSATAQKNIDTMRGIISVYKLVNS